MTEFISLGLVSVCISTCRFESYWTFSFKKLFRVALTACQFEKAQVLVKGIEGKVHALANDGEVAPGMGKKEETQLYENFYRLKRLS